MSRRALTACAAALVLTACAGPPSGPERAASARRQSAERLARVYSEQGQTLYVCIVDTKLANETFTDDQVLEACGS